jgi:hypothetical protein
MAGGLPLVRDSAIGHRPDDVERVFEPFVRSEAVTTRWFGGTAPGLPISCVRAVVLGGALRGLLASNSPLTLRIRPSTPTSRTRASDFFPWRIGRADRCGNSDLHTRAPVSQDHCSPRCQPPRAGLGPTSRIIAPGQPSSPAHPPRCMKFRLSGPGAGFVPRCRIVPCRRSVEVWSRAPSMAKPGEPLLTPERFGR